MFVEEIRRQAEAAPREALPAVTAALWRAFAEGHVSEVEAEALTALIEARQVSRPPDPGAGVGGAARRAGSPRIGVGSRPRTAASLTRRRRWAASGRLPPALAAQFTSAEQAALSFIATECVRRGDCRLAIGHIAAASGVSESTVRNALREARKLGLLLVEERRLRGCRNDTNVIRIIAPAWVGWLRLARRATAPVHVRSGHPGGGCKSVKGTDTKVLNSGKTPRIEPVLGCREERKGWQGSALPRDRAVATMHRKR